MSVTMPDSKSCKTCRYTEIPIHKEPCINCPCKFIGFLPDYETQPSLWQPIELSDLQPYTRTDADRIKAIRAEVEKFKCETEAKKIGLHLGSIDHFALKVRNEDCEYFLAIIDRELAS